jgi:hypothetical protein
MGIDPEKTTDRKHSVWRFSVRADEQVVDLPNGFISIIQDAATDDLGRAITG